MMKTYGKIQHRMTMALLLKTDVNDACAVFHGKLIKKQHYGKDSPLWEICVYLSQNLAVKTLAQIVVFF